MKCASTLGYILLEILLKIGRVVILLMMDGLPTFQSQSFMVMFLVLSSAQVHIKPYKETIEHKLQLFNNIYFYLLTLLQQTLQVNYMDQDLDTSIKSVLGLSIGGLICLNFAVNILVVVLAMLVKIFKMRKAKKSKEQQERAS